MFSVSSLWGEPGQRAHSPHCRELEPSIVIIIVVRNEFFLFMIYFDWFWEIEMLYSA